jgi:hypothetical protein
MIIINVVHCDVLCKETLSCLFMFCSFFLSISLFSSTLFCPFISFPDQLENDADASYAVINRHLATNLFFFSDHRYRRKRGLSRCYCSIT